MTFSLPPLKNDPTPADQAIYIPSITPAFAIDVHKAAWTRPFPAGVAPDDLNFLAPTNPLFRISHFMSSAGQALKQKASCIVNSRDRQHTRAILDSGGYQIATGTLKLNGDADRLKILRWSEAHGDFAMTLDIPPGPAGSHGYPFATMRDCLNETITNLDFIKRHRKSGAVGFLNVLQGNTKQDTDAWYDAVRGYPFEGWAFAGPLRANPYLMTRRVLRMAHDGLLENRNWIHILGTNTLQTAVIATALQRAINKHINSNLRISYDTSAPFRLIGQWRLVYSFPTFTSKKMTLQTAGAPSSSSIIDPSLKFPWKSELGDRLTLGDICVRSGQTTWDRQAETYLAHHNLSALCFAVANANRIFDAEAATGEHTIARPLAAVTKAIERVLASSSDQVLKESRMSLGLKPSDDDLINSDAQRA